MIHNLKRYKFFKLLEFSELKPYFINLNLKISFKPSFLHLKPLCKNPLFFISVGCSQLQFKKRTFYILLRHGYGRYFFGDFKQFDLKSARFRNFQLVILSLNCCVKCYVRQNKILLLEEKASQIILAKNVCSTSQRKKEDPSICEILSHKPQVSSNREG